jgi:uncharacterized protein
MSRWYLDTSAALKLLVEEAESAALAGRIDEEQPDLVACLLLETELRRVSTRTHGLTQAMVTGFLEGVDLFELPASLFQQAGLLPGPGLRPLDALHVAAAIRIGVDCVVTYDSRMLAAVTDLGLVPLSPL